MTPRCINCLHWDEDQADEQGYALCQELLNGAVVTEKDTIRITLRMVSGDDTCHRFYPKRVSPAPTHPSSETD